jgi:FkbH-like protein
MSLLTNWQEIFNKISSNVILTDNDIQILSLLDWKDMHSEVIDKVVALLPVKEAPSFKKYRPVIKKILLSNHSDNLADVIDPSDSLFPIYKAKQMIKAKEYNRAAEMLLGLKEYPSASDDEIRIAINMLKTIKCEGAAVELALSKLPDSPTVLNLVSSILDAYTKNLPKVNIGVLSYSTLDHIKKPLSGALAYYGFNADIRMGGYSQVIQELLSPDGAVNSQPLDAVFIILDFEGIFNIDWREPFENQDKLLKDKLYSLIDAIRIFIEKSKTPVIINSVMPPPHPFLGFLDITHPTGSNHIARMANAIFAEFANNNSQVLMIDSLSVLLHLKLSDWYDPKLWYYGKVPFAMRGMHYLAMRFADAFSTLRYGTKKVLALDLDNTLWGGILGEDGLKGIRCNDEFPGRAFKDFQSECLRLKALGMLLVIVSKNDPDAIDVFDKHSGMLLRKDDFAAHKINWMPKAENIAEISKELNLSLNSFVFIDDSYHERAAMRRIRPEVLVPELPDDPALRPQFLRSLTSTWVVRLTEEDRRRTEMYKEQSLREALKKQSGTIEDYLRSLEQTLSISFISDSNIARIAQLHMRTNQFNLTTLRLDEANLRGMMSETNRYIVICGKSHDRFGDYGIIITSVIELNSEEAEIKSLLMSCRVIGREIEKAFLFEIIKHLSRLGVRRVKGWYLPTAKNSQVADFYQRIGFILIQESDIGTMWSYDIESSIFEKPDFIRIEWN